MPSCPHCLSTFRQSHEMINHLRYNNCSSSRTVSTDIPDTELPSISASSIRLSLRPSWNSSTRISRPRDLSPLRPTIPRSRRSETGISSARLNRISFPESTLSEPNISDSLVRSQRSQRSQRPRRPRRSQRSGSLTDRGSTGSSRPISLLDDLSRRPRDPRRSILDDFPRRPRRPRRPRDLSRPVPRPLPVLREPESLEPPVSPRPLGPRRDSISPVPLDMLDELMDYANSLFDLPDPTIVFDNPEEEPAFLVGTEPDPVDTTSGTTGATIPIPLEPINAENKCIICLSADKDALLSHGGEGHVVCCFVCATRLKREGARCPICRKRIHKVIKMYY